MDTESGGEIPSILLNLRIHADPKEEARYHQTVLTTGKLFPRCALRVVDQGPWSGIADVRFDQPDGQPSIPLRAVSSGVQQVLTIVTSLVARDGMIFFLDHPETHLHPHAARFVYSLMVESSRRNQIVFTTHDPHLIDPDRPKSIRRFWSTPQGAKVKAISAESPKEWGQIYTAMKELADREVVIARSALVVEDESQRDFLIAVAPGSASSWMPMASRSLPWTASLCIHPISSFSVVSEFHTWRSKTRLGGGRQALSPFEVLHAWGRN